MNIFDFIQNESKPFDELTIEEAAEQINQRTGLNFKPVNLYDDFWSKYWSCKKNGMKFSISFGNYAPEINDGRRFLGVDVEKGNGCSCSTAWTIDEAVNRIRHFLERGNI